MGTETFRVVIIGAGPSGIFAARGLEKLAESQNKKIEITIFEKENELGGKCNTYKDGKLNTELGAILLSNSYVELIKAMEEHQIAKEEVLPFNDSSIEIKNIYNSKNIFGSIEMGIRLSLEIRKLNHDYEIYKKAKEALKDLPEELKLPFSEYAKLHGMSYLPTMLEPFVPGFGYGALTDCPTYVILEYVTNSTLSRLLFQDFLMKSSSVFTVREGFQSIMERVAKSFKYTEIKLNANVTEIDRENEKVTVCYSQGKDGKKTEIECDHIILAVPPTSWEDINLDTNKLEKEALTHLNYYNYPVAVCKIKGYLPTQTYFPSALKRTGFNHVALITTKDHRDDPEDGRLCTLYINLPPNTTEYHFDHDEITADIKASVEGVTDVTFVKEKIWEGYLCTVPWDIYLKFKKSQHENNTTYLSGFTAGFETVVHCVNHAVAEMNALYNKQCNKENSHNPENSTNKKFLFFTHDDIEPSKKIKQVELEIETSTFDL